MAQFQKFGLYSRVAEAELLALAGDVAEGGSEDSGEDWEQEQEEEEEVQLLPPPDLETEMTAGKVLPRPLPVSTPDPVERQRMMQAEFSYYHISTSVFTIFGGGAHWHCQLFLFHTSLSMNIIARPSRHLLQIC